MKKTYILTVMLLVLTVILSGCGSQDSDQASSGSFELSVEDTDTQGSSSGPEAPQVQETAIEVIVPSSMTLSMNDLRNDQTRRDLRSQNRTQSADYRDPAADLSDAVQTVGQFL